MKHVPNILSVFRIFLVPVFIAVYFMQPLGNHLLALGVFVFASATDVLDGIIARKYNAVSNLGRVLDPAGDKLMTFSVILCMTIDGIIPIWAVVLLGVKELLMLGGGVVIHTRGKVEIPPSNYLGKLSTVLFFVVCVLLMIFEDFFPGQIPQLVKDTMIAVAVSMMFVALGGYVKLFTTTMKDAKRKHQK